jgi:uncharacterized membrane protein
MIMSIIIIIIIIRIIIIIIIILIIIHRSNVNSGSKTPSQLETGVKGGLYPHLYVTN